MSTTVAAALARCASAQTWIPDMCDNFCGVMYGFSFSGYNTALDHWNQMPSRDKHPGSTSAPAGMLMFWGGGQGHVAISDGTGHVWSIDISGPGTVSRVPWTSIGAAWGKPYLGWSLPVFQGVEWSGSVISGVDVSGYQSADFATSGLDFAVVKATEGTTYTNPVLAGQTARSRAAGLVTGFYHFARPGSMTAQADFFLASVALRAGDFLALDWEDTGVSSAQKDQWIKYVQSRAPGRKVVLYCNKDFWINRDTSSFAGDGLWIATAGSPAGSPGIQAPWLLHQYSTAGGIDHDVAQFASRTAMEAWSGIPAPGGNVTTTDTDVAALYDNLTRIGSLTEKDAQGNPVIHTAGYYLAHAAADAAAARAAAQAVLAAVTDPGGFIDQMTAALENLKINVTVTEAP